MQEKILDWDLDWDLYIWIGIYIWNIYITIVYLSIAQFSISVGRENLVDLYMLIIHSYIHKL